jgi:hypothetical protein
MVKTMYEDVHVTSFGQDGNYSFWAMNDKQVNYTGGVYKIETFRYDGKSLGDQKSITGKADLMAQSSMMLHESSEKSQSPQSEFLRLTFEHELLHSPIERYHFFTNLTSAKTIQPSHLDVEFIDSKHCNTTDAKRHPKTCLKVTNPPNESSVPTFYVTLETESIPGFFTDNAFHLMPGQSKIITHVAKHRKGHEKAAKFGKK